MRFFWLNLAVLSFLVACKPHSSTDTKGNESGGDEAALLMDAQIEESIERIHERPDVSFDDFIYNFMQDSLFQKRRILFPLHFFNHGVVSHIPSSEWVYDEMYKNQDLYTLIYDSNESLATKSDSGLHQVIVENVYLQKQAIRQYCFVKRNHFWLLKQILESDMSKDVNHDFYTFYRMFTTDDEFQMQHIKNPFYFRTFDVENDQIIEGVLDSQQWPDYRPEMPKDTLTNINYGQHYEQSNKRVVLICSPSGGMGCTVTFVRHGHKWMFESLEN